MYIHCTLTQCNTQYTTIVYYDIHRNIIYMYYPRHERNKNPDKYKQYISEYCNWLERCGANILARDILFLYYRVRSINNEYGYWSCDRYNQQIKMYPSYDDDFPLCERFKRPQDTSTCTIEISEV